MWTGKNSPSTHNLFHQSLADLLPNRALSNRKATPKENSMNRLKKMIAGLQQARDGDLAVRLETSGRGDELDVLTEAIDHLLDRVQASHAIWEQSQEALRESQERHGRLKATIGGMVHEDITERQQTEEALRQANETLRATLDAAPVAILDLDTEGRVKSLRHEISGGQGRPGPPVWRSWPPQKSRSSAFW